MGAQLSVVITTASGEVYRWGPDEWDARNIPQAITFSSSMPVGFKTANITLPRRIDRDYPDLNLLDTVQILAAGNKVVWEGRVQQLPRSHQDSYSIQVGAVGWATHLMDDTSFREIYVSRDLSEWQGMSSARKLQLLGLKWTIGDGNVEPDPVTGLPAIRLSIQDSWPAVAATESMFDAGSGCKVAAIFWERVSKSNYSVAGQPEAAFAFNVGVADDDQWANFTMNPDTHTANEDTDGPSTYEPSTPRRWGGMQWSYGSSGGAPGVTWDSFVRHLAVFGDHELPKRGEDPYKGYYASDVIADIVSRAAPLLNFTVGQEGSIQPTTFPIPHLVFRDPTSAQAAIMRTNGYHLWDWGVWEDREFFYREPDPDRLTWQARLSDGAKLDLEGTQVDDVYNGVFVSYSESAGKAQTVGPPGSGADATSSELVDTSPTNPVNAHGIPKKWSPLSISQPTTLAGAIRLGAIHLAEKALPQRRGTLTLTGTVRHPSGGLRDVSEVRAGDWVRIADFPTEGPRKIIEATYDSARQTVTCTLDNTSQKVDAIIERMVAALAGRI